MRMDPPALSEARAQALIAKLGFLVVHDPGEAANAAASWHLVVALRAEPTTTHFDPEQMSWWTIAAGRGVSVSIDRSRPLPAVSDVLWGPMRVDDRFHIQNTFLTFGGTLRSFAPDETTSIVVMDSWAPIMRWAGHSQDLDPLATDVAVFFARLRLPVCFEPGVEQRVAAVAPLALYAAFLEDRQARYRRAPLLGDVDPTRHEWFAREAARLFTTSPAEWEAGHALLDDVGLGHETPVPSCRDDEAARRSISPFEAPLRRSPRPA